MVYVKLSPQSLFIRLRDSHKERPLTVGKSQEELLQYVQTTLAERENDYVRAHLVVKGENLLLNELVEKLQAAGWKAL